MNIHAMDPYGRALWDAFRGDPSAKLTVRRDDGAESEMPMGAFFPDPSEFSPIVVRALELCRGNILDSGAGAGCHALELQKQGHQVWAIDIAPQAVKIMKKRGVLHAHCKNIFELENEEFDTILMLMHGIGLVETLAGLEKFLIQARRLLKPDGRLIFDSLDVRHTTEAIHLRYLDGNRRAGRYFGEIRSRFEYKGQIGEYFSWLHVDPDTLENEATKQGWASKIIHQEPNGDYLTCLTLKTAIHQA